MRELLRRVLPAGAGEDEPRRSRGCGRGSGRSSGRHPADRDGIAEAADLASRCAGLLRAGAVPSRAIGFAATRARADSAVARAAARIEEGTRVCDAIAANDGPGWRVLAAAWALGEQSGAPIAPALDRIAATLRAMQQLRERRTVLLAGPRATIRLVTVLPPLALLLGWGLGFDPWRVLLSALGAVLLALGGGLLCAGVLWARAMARRHERRDRPAGVGLELFWIALGGGAGPQAARSRVVDAVDRFGVEWVEFAELCDSGSLAAATATAEQIGAPLRPVLVEAADSERQRAQAELERGAERLGIGVLVPLAVCVLPAFVLMGVLPVVIAMFGGVSLP